jgi:hypothetical protein
VRTHLSFSDDLSLDGELLLVLETSSFFDAFAGTVARLAFGLTAFCTAKGEGRKKNGNQLVSKKTKSGDRHTFVELRFPLSLSLLLRSLKVPFDLRKPFLRFERFSNPLEGDEPDALVDSERRSVHDRTGEGRGRKRRTRWFSSSSVFFSSLREKIYRIVKSTPLLPCLDLFVVVEPSVQSSGKTGEKQRTRLVH